MMNIDLTSNECLIIEEFIDESLITEEYKGLEVINCTENEYHATNIEKETIDDWIDLR